MLIKFHFSILKILFLPFYDSYFPKNLCNRLLKYISFIYQKNIFWVEIHFKEMAASMYDAAHEYIEQYTFGYFRQRNSNFKPVSSTIETSMQVSKSTCGFGVSLRTDFTIKVKLRLTEHFFFLFYFY